MKERNTMKEGSKGHRSVPNNKEQLDKEKSSNDKQRMTAGEQAGTPLSLRCPLKRLVSRQGHLFPSRLKTIPLSEYVLNPGPKTE